MHLFSLQQQTAATVNPAELNNMWLQKRRQNKEKKFKIKLGGVIIDLFNFLKINKQKN